ncbi:MAG: lysyl-tRNA synthetase, class [Acidobacteriota bacterium]|nr:lysyl-tRNA synthetase, class [Acidobacteriota bacterium]
MTENNQTPFIEDNDQTRARREHLERIQQLTGNAYPNKFRRTNLTASAEGEDTITSVVAQFKHHEPPRAEGQRPTPEQLEAANAALKAFGDVRVSGRLAVPPRVMGKAAFVHLSDGRERLQIYVRRDDVQQLNHRGRTLDGWELFSLLDHGDFIGVEGFLFVTKTGELSVHVREFEFLAKALLPMPDKMHGISDPEIRQRQRYADLIAGSLKIDKDEEGGAAGAHELTTREVFERRSKIIREMRAFLDERGYIEVETPMLTPIASGAAARPFKTHHNALDIDLYARIAPELYLKRLVVGGFERVYELNRNFRNEGISTRHNPEFTMLEFYCAYMDVNGMMDFCEEMLRQSVEKATGKATVRFGEQEFDFSHRFERLSMIDAILKYWPKDERREVFKDKYNFDKNWLKDVNQARLTLRLLSEMGVHTLIAKRELREAGLDVTPSVVIEKVWQAVNKGDELLYKYDSTEGETERGQYIQGIFEIVAEAELIQPTFITDFPKPISPLSKASPDDPSVAERFELFINGMECANGFSELNDPVEQYERFREQGQARERGDEEAMQMDTDYVRALAYGMPPAAGIGIGIDRIVMLLTNRRSIRDVILFPHMRPAAAAPKVEEAATDETAESTNEQAGGQGA